MATLSVSTEQETSSTSSSPTDKPLAKDSKTKVCKIDCITGDPIEEDMYVSLKEGENIYHFSICTLLRQYAVSGSLENPFTKNSFPREIILVLENYANLVFRCNGIKFQLNGFLTVGEAYVKIFRIAEELGVFADYNLRKRLACTEGNSKEKDIKFSLRNITRFDIRIDEQPIFDMDYDREIYQQLGRNIKAPLTPDIEHIITFYPGVQPKSLEKIMKYISKTSIPGADNIVEVMKKELTYGTIIKIHS